MAAHRGHAVPAHVSAECAIVRASGPATTEWVRVKPSGPTGPGTSVGLTSTVGHGTSRRTRAPVEDHLCAHGSVRRGRGMWRSMRQATASPPRRGRSPASRRATRSARPRHRHSPISSAILSRTDPARSSYCDLTSNSYHRHCRRRASALQGAARVTSACARRRQSRLDRLTRRGAPPRRRRSGYSRGPRTCQIKATPSPSCMSFAVLLARRDGMRTTTHISIFISSASHPGC